LINPDTEMKTVLAFLLLASVAVASVVTFSMKYTLTDDVQYPNGHIPGKAYYKYDTENKEKSRVRYENYFTGGLTFSEIENYEVKRLFKICPGKCESEVMKNTPQQWWYMNGDTKTDKHESNFYQYTRKPGDYGLTELWLSDQKAPSTAANLKKIVFTTGRTLSFDIGTYTTNVDAKKFDENSGQNCSEKSCRTYLDIIFVLDSSVSVDATEWEKQRAFVVNVTKHFEIGRNSVAIGAVAFGGSEHMYVNCPTGYCNTSVEEIHAKECPSELDGIQRDPTKTIKCRIKRCETDVSSTKPGSRCYEATQVRGNIPAEGPQDLKSQTSNDPIVGATVLNKYVFFNPTYTINIASQSFYNKDFTMYTCQGWGLEEAYSMLTDKKKNSRLADGVQQPKKMVIVMTDGVDFCRNRTRMWAKKLKELGAVMIEVGIGLYYQYDTNFLKELSTDLGGGNPAMFSVDDFDGLTAIVDNLGLVTCQTEYGQSGSCSPECHGYCACGGECYCPECTGVTDLCHNVSCVADPNHVISSGCVAKDKDCPSNDWCDIPYCDANDGKCFTKKRSCEEWKNVTRKPCQKDLCTSVGADSGTCEFVNDSSLCTEIPGPCYEGVCNPSLPGSDSNGCAYRYMCTGPAEYQPGNSSVPAKGCMIYSCDKTNNKCNDPIDICAEVGYGFTDMCNTYQCNTNTGVCELVKEKDCGEKPCEVVVGCDGATGVCKTKPKDRDYCKSQFIEAVKNKVITGVRNPESYYECGTYSCADQSASKPSSTAIGNCRFTPTQDTQACQACIPGTGQGDETNVTCAAEAVTKHNQKPASCYTGICEGYKTSWNKWNSRCNFVEFPCTPSDACHEVVCDPETRACNETIIDPESYENAVKNRKFCQEISCNKYTKKYELVDASSKKCPSDNCNISTCVNDEGILGHCNVRPYCEDRLCKNTVCNPSAPANRRCTYTDVVCEATNNCFKASCDSTTGKCKEIGKSIDEACPNDDRCVKMVCNVENGTCSAVTILPPNSDPCLVYVCDNETGNLTTYAKCDDQNICTDDICTYDGRCINTARTCEELDMEEFGVCFDRACSKSRKNGCYRKVNPHSYFDECGNCVRGYSATDSGVSNEELASCKDALKPYVPAAIGAGVIAAIIIACIIGAAAVTTAGTLATRELIRRARAANSQGAHDNPLFEEDGQEMENPTFVGSD